MTTVACVAESLEAPRGARAWREVISRAGRDARLRKGTAVLSRPFRGSNFRQKEAETQQKLGVTRNL